MVKRFYFVPDFKFDNDQRARLIMELAALEIGADRFLDNVEARTRDFIAEIKNFKAYPLLKPSEYRKQLMKWDETAKQLEELLNNRDSMGDGSAIRDSLFLLRQSPDTLDQLEQQLMVLRVAAQMALKRAPVPRGGHPFADHDIGFIAQIAIDHERLFGSLPSGSRGGWFCGFIDTLFSVIPGKGNADIPEHYRLVSEAMRRIAEVRQSIDIQADSESSDDP